MTFFAFSPAEGPAWSPLTWPLPPWARASPLRYESQDAWGFSYGFVDVGGFLALITVFFWGGFSSLVIFGLQCLGD